MHQSVLTDIDVARPSATAPIVWFGIRNVGLEPVKSRVILALHIMHFEEHFPFFTAQWAQLPVAVVNDSYR